MTTKEKNHIQNLVLHNKYIDALADRQIMLDVLIKQQHEVKGKAYAKRENKCIKLRKEISDIERQHYYTILDELNNMLGWKE